MIVDIFTSFDPCIYLDYKIFTFRFWVSILIRLLVIIERYWMSYNSLFWVIFRFLRIMSDQAGRTFSINLKGFRSLIISLFIIIILVNLISLMPYRFRFSSHLVFRLTYSLPLWMLLVISSISYSWRYFVANLLVGGAPTLLNPFLVIVDTISTLVRSITLSVRLSANIRAGHIVLGLITAYACYYMWGIYCLAIFLFLLMVGVGYCLFEVGVCLIQSYIFSLLLRLYSNDHSVL